MHLAAYWGEFKAWDLGTRKSRTQNKPQMVPERNPPADFQIRATIVFMQIAVFAMRVLEAMFFLGLAGSTIVVLISFVEDAKELFGED
jgi:hypothetical protein